MFSVIFPCQLLSYLEDDDYLLQTNVFVDLTLIYIAWLIHADSENDVVIRSIETKIQDNSSDVMVVNHVLPSIIPVPQLFFWKCHAGSGIFVLPPYIYRSVKKHLIVSCIHPSIANLRYPAKK